VSSSFTKGIDDHHARLVVANEQSIRLKELGSKPVLVLVPER
jgi:hypothetical protein